MKDDNPILGEHDTAATTPSKQTEDAQPAVDASGITRASAAWVATGVALLLLILLVVFILQNQTQIEISFLWMSGTIPTGVALLIGALAGGLLVAAVGLARVIQLRKLVRQTTRAD